MINSGDGGRRGSSGCNDASECSDGDVCTRCHGRDTLPGVRLNCRGSVPEAVSYGAALALRSVPGAPALQGAIATYKAAPAKTQEGWSKAYAAALEKATVGPNGAVRVVSGEYGPVPVMMNGLLALAQSGGLEGGMAHVHPRHNEESGY